MAKTSSGKKNKDQGRQAISRLVLWALVVCFALSGVIWGAQQLQHFLITDSRFILQAPVDYGQESPSLRIEGVRFADRSQIARVFATDMGRSVYLVPLGIRRQTLLRCYWVQDATVVRQWPNRIVVRITERHPSAFVDIGTECINRYTLIDSEGVFLEPPDRPNPFAVPQLRGIPRGEPANDRGVRVRRAQSFLKELGPLSSAVYETDVSDPGDLKVTLKMENHGITVILGDRNFHDRLQHFLDHYAEIHKRAPNMRVFDLRLDDRITAAPEVKRGC